MTRKNYSEESESLLAKTLNQSAKAFGDICKSYPGKVAEGVIGGIVSGVTSGMSYRTESGMMALHAILGAAWGLGTLKTFFEGISALNSNDENIKKAEIEIRVFKELMRIKGEENSVAPIISTINDTLKRKGAPELSEEVILQLTHDPQEKNFDDLVRKVSDVNSRNLLIATSMLGIVSTVAGFAVMEAYKNDLPETIFTATAAATTSFSSGLLNATASSSANISENTYLAIKNMNDGIFFGLQSSLAEEGRSGELSNIRKIRDSIRVPSARPKNESSAKVVSTEAIGVELV